MKVQDIFEMSVEAFSQIRKIFQSNFGRRNIELNLPAHAFERAVEGERGAKVTEEYLITAFQQLLKKIDNKHPDLVRVFEAAKQQNQQSGIQVTFKFPVENTFLNFPTVIKHLGRNKFKLTLKTVMVKSNFKTYKNDFIVFI